MFDKDLFYSLCEKYDVEFSDEYDKPMLRSDCMESEESRIIERLFSVVTELDARDCGSNSVMSEYHNTSWNDLCDIGAELFEHLKK